VFRPSTEPACYPDPTPFVVLISPSINTKTVPLQVTVNKHVRVEVSTAVTMKNGVSRLLRRVALVRTDVSEELNASFIRVKKSVN
jgi:hypothetical protein